MIKITKKTIGATGSNVVRLHLSPKYLSNGHWAVLRASIDPRMNSAEALQTICYDVVTVEDSKIDGAIKSGIAATRKFTVSAWLYETSAKTREFARVAVAENGARMYLSEDYCQSFGLTAGAELYANDGDSVARGGTDVDPVYIMPRRGPGAEFELRPTAEVSKPPKATRAPKARPTVADVNREYKPIGSNPGPAI